MKRKCIKEIQSKILEIVHVIDGMEYIHLHTPQWFIIFRIDGVQLCDGKRQRLNRMNKLKSLNMKIEIE